jgi:hypothetical protein
MSPLDDREIQEAAYLFMVTLKSNASRLLFARECIYAEEEDTIDKVLEYQPALRRASASRHRTFTLPEKWYIEKSAARFSMNFIIGTILNKSCESIVKLIPF